MQDESPLNDKHPISPSQLDSPSKLDSLRQHVPVPLDQLLRVAEMFGGFAEQTRMDANVALSLAELLRQFGGEHALMSFSIEAERRIRLFSLSAGHDCNQITRSERESTSIFSDQKGRVIEEVDDAIRACYGEVFPGFQLSSLLHMPLVFHGRAVGALQLLSCEKNVFRLVQLEALKPIASAWALMWERERLMRESQRSLERLRSFINMSRQVNSSLDLDDSLRSLSHAAKQILGMEKTAVLLLEERFNLALKSGISMRTAEELLNLLNDTMERFFHERKPLVLHLADLMPNLEERECTQLILLPMLYQEKVKGVFALFLASYQHLVPEELLFIQTLANQAALAVENATLFQEVQQRAQEFSTLFEIAQTLTSSLGTKAIVDRILAAAQTLIGAERGFVFQRVGDSQEMECIMASGPYSKQILGKLLQLGEGITGFVAQTGIGERIDDTTHDPRALHISDTPEEPESMIVVPLKRKDQVFGVMTLSRVGVRPFREDDFRLISIFSTFAAATMENTRLYDEAAQMAITDYLTGLYNYRYFFKRLEEELSYSRRHGQKLSIVVIDLDRFKQYNDTYGHQEGDRLLASVGDALRASIRLSDVAFRYGGDEFSIIFPDTERREAQVVIDRLSERFHSMLPQNSLVQVRPSFGVATFPTDATDGEAIFRLADQRMYAMKEGHR